MATVIGDAAIKVTIDDSQARRTAEKLDEDRKTKEVEEQRDKDRDKDRERRRERDLIDGRGRGGGGTFVAPSGGRSVPGRQVTVTREVRRERARARAGQLISAGAATFLAAGAAALAVEEFGPIVSGAVDETFKGTPLEPLAGQTTAQINATANAVSAARAGLTAGITTARELGSIARTRAIVGSEEEDAQIRDAKRTALALLKVNFALAKQERDRARFQREALGAWGADALSQIFTQAFVQ